MTRILFRYRGSRMTRFFRFTIVAVLAFPLSSARAGSSNSLLDVSPDGKFLLAANADNGTVAVVDTRARKSLREITVGEKPEGVAWVGNGPMAAVTLYRDRQVVLFNAETGSIVKRIDVKAEPYGIVADKKGTRLWVSHEYPALVSEIDVAAAKVVRVMPAGQMLRGIALTPDETRIYVTEFTTGVLHAIDLASGQVVDSWSGHSTDNLARHVAVHPTRPKAYLAHLRSMVTVNDGSGSIFPQLSIVDLKPGKEKRRTSFAMDTFNKVYVVTNPWESALSPDGKRFYIIYAGTNDMNFCDVVDDDYTEIASKGIARLGNNPRAVRVAPDGSAVYIYNALDFSVSVHDPISMKKVADIKVCEPPKSPEWVRGKVLFNTALPPLTSRRWVACFSCHPDGHSDARVWQQPEGLRKTTAFFGMAHTHPLHYSADRDEVQDFEFTIRSKLMRGAGLIKGPFPMKLGFHKVELDIKTSGRSPDLDALAIYSNSFQPELSPHIAAPGKLPEAAERGKALFFAKETACASCHSGPYYSDSTLQKPYKIHDIGTGSSDPSERMGAAYDTPTLLGVYRTAPYLHHGKAATLHEVFTKHNPNDQHGKTSHLNPAQIDDLVAFLKCLPYEAPPDETPNTVPYRLKK
jgi:YVTN family beta-propeller protein